MLYSHLFHVLFSYILCISCTWHIVYLSLKFALVNWVCRPFSFPIGLSLYPIYVIVYPQDASPE